MLQLFNHQRRLKSGTNGLIYMDFPKKIKPFENAPPYLGLRNKIPGPHQRPNCRYDYGYLQVVTSPNFPTHASISYFLRPRSRARVGV